MAEQTVISALDLADELGIENPTEAQEGRISDVILDAQADVEGYLNRALFGFEVTRAGVWKDSRYPGEDFRAWPWATDEYDDEFTVRSYTANADGTFDVTLYVGLGDDAMRGVIRYVKSHVRETLTHDPTFTGLARGITSVSAEGQSISYDKASTAQGAAGAPATLESLRRHRRYSAHRARTRTAI